jgi:hypothetical protein
MSISTKIALTEPGSYLRVELDIDLVFCGDRELEFIIAFYRGLREFVKHRDAELEKRVKNGVEVKS